MDDERFDLEGATYYRQGRRCGKPACRCANGDLHGPYWYSRTRYGKVAYLGRELPPEVVAALAGHRALFREMQTRRDELLGQVEALGRLLRCESLRDGDQATIEALGFGAALVPPADELVAQAGGAR